ncbi:hypothetical protein PMM47T1_03219 [Pseudomonas sp. M47T1]|uniref:hypothetical protein n=1 Tax=Pseudomonas sp. M47T1 TaxID=1179778 RepID=UPI0002606712|nr:hypothetical protein [Pseudomonas sp. M47T1]EIK98241.1 hypothetical protein PMM47T1_03219 [Pseudomonas sp. M47T1]
MKSLIVSGIALLALGITTAQAADLQGNVVPASTGAPGTPTPTPYPQVSTAIVPKAGGVDGSSPLLPPIKVPGPPKDEPLPALESPNKPPM